MKYSIFCDESGIIREKYMVLGGIILPTQQVSAIEAKIKRIKEKEMFLDHEVKFSKLKNTQKLRLYKEILSETYLNQEHNIDFRCIIFDTEQIRHKDFADINNDIHYNDEGFYKQYYQLLYHQFFKFNPKDTFYCYLDEKGSKKTSSVCISKLDLHLKRKTPDTNIKCIQDKNSKLSELLQLTDLLVGATALDANNRSSRKEKLELTNFLRTQKGFKKLSDTNNQSGFRVWNFDYSKSKKVPISSYLNWFEKEVELQD